VNGELAITIRTPKLAVVVPRLHITFSVFRFAFDGCRPLLRLLDARHVELFPAVEAVDAVLFLVHVGQLGVAVAEHVRIPQQRGALPLETLIKFLQAPGRSP